MKKKRMQNSWGKPAESDAEKAESEEHVTESLLHLTSHSIISINVSVMMCSRTLSPDCCCILLPAGGSDDEESEEESST